MNADAEAVVSAKTNGTALDERTPLLPSAGKGEGRVGGDGAGAGCRTRTAGKDAGGRTEPRAFESDGGGPPQYRRRHIHHHHHHLPALLESLTLPTVTPVNLIVASPCTFHPESDTESEQGGSQSQAAQRKLLVVTLLALVFFVMELVGGYYANSLALMSDSFHLLSDVAGFVISLTAIYLSSQPATKRHSFGFHRAEVLGALLSIALIYGMTGVLVWEAIERLKNPQPIDARTMLVISSLGVAVNVVLAITLGHDHHHGHDHHYGHDHDHRNDYRLDRGHGHDGHDNHSRDFEDGRAHRHAHSHSGNINIRAAAIHVIGDLIASVGVLISSIVILLSPETAWVDPMCTLVFAFLVLVTTFRIVVDSIQVLMEGTPGHIDPAVVQASLNRIPGVIKVYDLHVWNLTTGKISLTAHLIVSSLDPSTGCQLQPDGYNGILESAQSLLKSQFGVVHSTLQIRLVHSPCVAGSAADDECGAVCQNACDERCAER